MLNSPRAKDGEQLVVIIVEEVEALVGSAVGGHGSGNDIEFLDSLGRIGEWSTSR